MRLVGLGLLSGRLLDARAATLEVHHGIGAMVSNKAMEKATYIAITSPASWDDTMGRGTGGGLKLTLMAWARTISVMLSWEGSQYFFSCYMFLYYNRS